MKALLNALQIVLEPVSHQNRPAVRAFDQVFQRVQFPLVEEQAVVLSVVDAAVGQLAQLARQGRCVDSVDLCSAQGGDQIAFQFVVGFALRQGKPDRDAV